jgi:hypothetical protein
MYWDCSGRILSPLNSSLHESLGLDPVIILETVMQRRILK